MPRLHPLHGSKPRSGTGQGQNQRQAASLAPATAKAPTTRPIDPPAHGFQEDSRRDRLPNAAVARGSSERQRQSDGRTRPRRLTSRWRCGAVLVRPGPARPGGEPVRPRQVPSTHLGQDDTYHTYPRWQAMQLGMTFHDGTSIRAHTHKDEAGPSARTCGAASCGFCEGKLERAEGFEPSTPTLARLCSTPELRPRASEGRF